MLTKIKVTDRKETLITKHRGDELEQLNEDLTEHAEEAKPSPDQIAAEQEKDTETEKEIGIQENVAEKNIYEKQTLKETIAAKEEDEEKKKEAQYHNCIFIDGKDLNNFIVNSGYIKGNIDQSTNDENADAAESFVFNKKEDISKFIEVYSETNYVPILITIVALKAVPENYLLTLAGELKRQLYKSTLKTNEDEAEEESIFQSINDILRILNAEKMNATIRSNAGDMTVQCIILKDKSFIKEISTTLWKNYHAMRPLLISWLIKISRLKNIRKTILWQIVEAVTEFAALDIAYTINDIIPLFLSTKNRDNFYFLTRILGKCLRIKEYEGNVNELLCHWCGLDNEFLWQVAYYLYDNTQEYAFNSSLRKRLIKVIKQELKSGIEFKLSDIIYTYPDYSKIKFDLLQEKSNMSEIYIEIIAYLFRKCETRNMKIRFGYYFINLFWQDYLKEGYPVYEVLFIQCMNRKNLREKMRPLIIYIWQKRIFREEMENVLCIYGRELEKNHRSWDYMKNFLKMIAFTNEEEDFKNVIRMFDRAMDTDPGKSVAVQMKKYLMDLLNNRIAKKKGELMP